MNLCCRNLIRQRHLGIPMNITDFLFSFRNQGYSLSTDSYSIVEMDAPEALTYPLNCRDGMTCSSLLERGEEVATGQPIWKVDDRNVFPSPVQGEVIDIVNVPDARGDKMVPSVIVKPDDNQPDSPFPALDPEKETAATLRDRIEAAGILTDRISPRPLLDLLSGSENEPLDGVVVLAMDREPMTTTYLQQFRERLSDALSATDLLGKIAGVGKLKLALPETEKAAFQEAVSRRNIEPLWIPPTYPQTLDPFVIKRSGLTGTVAVISIEAALSAYDAVVNGHIQKKKVITVVAPDNTIIGNYRVWIGTRFREILDHVGLKLSEKDKIVAGGPMQGFAQYSLDGTVDSGINSLMLIPRDAIVPWTTEPCINCGKCIDACPVQLQVQLIGRYSEFSLFERTTDYDIDDCIECGLCASVCTARRPLRQLIDLARDELAGQAVGETAGGDPEQAPTVKGRRVITPATGDPALQIFLGLPRFTVGFPPHWRSAVSITRLNIAFILALLPTIVVAAFAQFYGPLAVPLDSSVTSVSGVLKTVVLELGLDSGFLWFTGVFGLSLLGMGAGIVVEYICQVLMRQPFHATNGHGALMGLLIALLMPPSAPAWVLLAAIIVAIFMAKQVFGGIGGYPLHPALVGWLVVYLSWPQYVYPIGTASIAGFNDAVITATVLGGLGLLAAGFIRLEITLGVIIGTIVTALLFGGYLDGGMGEQLMTGHVFLAAFFLATDATSSPANRVAMWIYGLGTGFLIILIRAFGVWPDAVPFAVLLMNIVSPLLDRIKPKTIRMET